MNRWWANLLAILILAGLATWGALWLRDQPRQEVVWVARQDLDTASPLDEAALVRERKVVPEDQANTWIPADQDLSHRALRQTVKKGVVLRWADLAEMVTVVRAVRPVDKGTTIEQGMVAPQDLAPSEKLPDAVTRLEDVLGRAATVDLEIGDQVLEKDLIDLIDVPVPGGTVKRGEVVPTLESREMLPAEVPAAAVLTATLAEGKLATANLYQGEPILAANVCDFRDVPVPAAVIDARSVITAAWLVEQRMCLSQITTGSVLEEQDLVGKLALRNLAPGLPVEKAAIDDPVAGVWVPARVILSGSRVEPEDLISITVGAREVVTPGFALSKESLAGKTAAQLLLPGKPVLESAVSAEPVAYSGTLDLVVTDTGAQGGSLEPGSLVDVYASPRLFLDSTAKPVVLDVPGLADHFPVQDAKVVLIEPLEGGRFRVRLTLRSVGDIQGLMEAAPRVEFYLVLPTP